jgi:uncharacterized membrane protein YjgN (DUF898 family)
MKGRSLNNEKITPITFNGKASEYFGIWIVNLLLTLLTLGIYSAWAKVRRKKYFYHNTLIDGVGFDYHAKPIAILKGRIIAFIFFVAYAFGGHLNPFIPAFAMLVIFIALPWLVVRASTFNARNTSHRGLRFDFVGKLGEAVRVFIVLPIIMVFTLWLAAPFVSHQKNKFLMNGHRFGLSQFNMQAKVKSFYKVYAIFLIIPLIGILAAIAIPAYQSYVKKAHAQQVPRSEIAVPNSLGFVDIPQQGNTLLAENEVPESPMQNDTGAEQTIPVAEGPMADDAAQSYEAPSAAPEHEKTLEEMMQEREKARQDRLKNMFKNPAAFFGFLIFMVAYLFFIFLFVAYVQSRIGNLVWNNTTLDQLSFKSTLRARGLFWLYISNLVVIVCTFGLATPWAQIRAVRYRTSHLAIVGDVNFDQFVGGKKDEMKATGEEIADFFDVDLSFG